MWQKFKEQIPAVILTAALVIGAAYWLSQKTLDEAKAEQDAKLAQAEPADEVHGAGPVVGDGHLHRPLHAERLRAGLAVLGDGRRERRDVDAAMNALPWTIYLSFAGAALALLAGVSVMDALTVLLGIVPGPLLDLLGRAAVIRW